MDKQRIKEAIKEMFEYREIQIKVEQKDRWESRYLVVTVDIDDEKVYEYEEYIGSSGWSDN